MATVPSGSANAWAFGVRSNGTTYALRSVGDFAESWVSVEVPDVGRVHGLVDSWVAAEKGTLRWVDGRWHRVPVPGGAVLRAVAEDPVAEGMAWAVGVEPVPGTAKRRGAVRRWDGTRWRNVPVPPRLSGDSSELSSVLINSDSVDVYGIAHDRHRGSRVLALRFDGESWSALSAPVPLPGHEEHLVGYNGQAHRLVGWSAPVGGSLRSRVPLIYRVDSATGQLAREEVPGVAGQLTAVTSEYGTPVAVGFTAWQRPLAMRLRFDGDGRSSWIIDDLTGVPDGQLSSVGGTLVPNIWAVGISNERDATRPLMVRYNP
nr:hypothetical protein [Kibdelosporangium sp. MJ126-NF4]